MYGSSFNFNRARYAYEQLKFNHIRRTSCRDDEPFDLAIFGESGLTEHRKISGANMSQYANESQSQLRLELGSVSLCASAAEASQTAQTPFDTLAPEARSVALTV